MTRKGCVVTAVAVLLALIGVGTTLYYMVRSVRNPYYQGKRVYVWAETEDGQSGSIRASARADCRLASWLWSVSRRSKTGRARLALGPSSPSSSAAFSRALASFACSCSISSETVS